MAIGDIGHPSDKFQTFNKLIIFLLLVINFYFDDWAWISTTIVTPGDLAVDRGNTLATAL